ncbi:Retrovirus-related Pol polyprotein from transposon RE1 [Vitis vinifera]|uniref:Retrovirus-related Pol polyprotein from transposon RE1 n=1 Tax=Vitis vinifera TaxID=29760 RepID=A0A438IVJ3_VITVI|nr:Retrovirus-related Pol polyprotein from transposon RE1 [Vitis vinifera]
MVSSKPLDNVYVDDIIIIGPNTQVIQFLKTFLHTQFKLKDLGCLKYFLGLEIDQLATGIVLCQRHYTLQLLEDTKYLACKPASIPMDPKVQLNAHDGVVLSNVSQYRRLIGCLLYLTLSRLDPYLAPSIPCMTSLSPSREVKDGYYTVGTAVHATVLLSHGNMNSTRSSLVLGTMGVSQYGNNDIQKCIPANPSNNLSCNHPASLLKEMDVLD